MEIKANFHFHTRDDIEDKRRAAMVADHDLFQGLDEAKKLGFGALAVTCHNFVTDDPNYYDYAKQLGITLVSGVEKTVGGRDVLILNARKEAEAIETFDDLRTYRQSHPESFVMAPHPFFDGDYSLGRKLVEHIDLFDAVEYSWFHFKLIDLNRKGAAVAREHRLPFIATSDTHDLRMLGTSYAIIDAADRSVEAILEAAKAGKIANTSPDAKFWSGYVLGIIFKTIRNHFRKPRG